MGVGDELERLASLHERGVIDDDEFAAAKRQILHGQSLSEDAARREPPAQTSGTSGPMAGTGTGEMGAGQRDGATSGQIGTGRSDKRSGGAWPTSIERSQASDTSGLKVLGGWAQWLVWGSAAVFGIAAVLGLVAWGTYENYLSGAASAADSVGADDAYWAAVGFGFFAMLPAAVVVIVWLYRHHKRLSTIAGPDMKYSHGWTIGGWFIPIGNLWIPKRIVDDLWRRSGRTDGVNATGDSEAVPARNHWWWALWIAGAILNQIAGAMTPQDQGGWQAFYAVTVTGDAAWATAGGLFGFTVRDISRRTFTRLTNSGGSNWASTQGWESSSTPQRKLPPAGWYDDPETAGWVRYWDGSRWTDRREPSGGPS